MIKALVDNRIDAKIEKSLLEKGFEIIKLPPFDRLQPPVSAHPDMLLHVARGRLICHKDYFVTARKELTRAAEQSGLSIVLTYERVDKEYPNDILFNAAAVGDKLICKSEHTSARVKELYPEQSIINVKQGYAKCSTCVVGSNAIITADVSIADAAERRGIDVLRVSAEGVSLDGYNIGFIGGASGLCGDSLYFCGNIELHPDGEGIKAFCEAHGVRAVSLSDEPLYDYGTLMFID